MLPVSGTGSGVRRRRVRACHIIHSLQTGGAERVLVGLAQVAAAEGIDLTVISLMGASDYPYVAALRDTGIPVRVMSVASRWDPRILHRVERVISQVQPDVLHSHLKHADIVGAYVGSRLQIPLLSSLHLLEDAVSPVGRVKRRAGAEARNRTARFILPVSDHLRTWYLHTFPVDPERVRTLHNGISVPPPPPAAELDRRRAAFGIGEGSVTVAMIGVMRPGKGHMDLLAACTRLPDGTQINVVMAGDGPLRTEVEEAVASDTRLRHMVRLLGHRDDIDALLSVVDLVVHPSYADALPTALIQAIGSGVPVLAYGVGGVPEIVSDREGVVVPVGDLGALTRSMTEICADPARRATLGAAGRRRYEDEFTAARWAQRLRELYLEARS